MSIDFQTAGVELDIDTRLSFLWDIAEMTLEQPEKDLALVGSLMRAAWGRGYYDGLDDPKETFLQQHGLRRTQ